MRKNKLRFLALNIICLFSLSCFATNYYISTSGNDSNPGTSLAQPFATLAKALSRTLVGGDTIFVRSGTYTSSTTINITKSGTSTRNIVLTAYLPDLVNANSRPLFDFSAMTVSSSKVGINMSAAAYWNVYGLVIKGAGDNGMILQNTCHHVKIEFCAFTRNRDSGLQLDSRTHHCYIVNCDSYENADLGTGTTSSGGNADGFAPKLDVGDSIFFKGCRAWMNSDDGWDGYLKVFESGLPDGMTTFLEDCWAFRNGYYWLDNSTTTSMNGNGIKMGGSSLKNQAHHFVVKRCLTFLNKAKGFDQNGNAGSMYLHNNTAYKNGDSDFGLNSSGVTYSANSALVVINCNSFGSKGKTIRSSGGGPITQATNSFITNTSTNPYYLSTDTTGATGMRGLDGSLPTLNFMRLSPTSSYIDAGTILPDVVYNDSLGMPFYGTKPDIGAFETKAPTVYTYVDNGNWSAQSKWGNHNMPPQMLFPGSTVNIDPLADGQCTLDRPVTIPSGCTINVMAGKIFYIPQMLQIQ